ncbi:hypothetical protein LQW54_007323 [Pestalotiopsis sp. IQ-011]
MPSEDKPVDHDEDGGGSVNQNTSGMPLAESAENGNTSTTSEEELHHLRSKVVEMESKMVAVDKLHDLHKSTVEAMDYSKLPAVPWSSANGLPFAPKKSRDYSDLYTAVVFFLRWLQSSHQELVKDDLKTEELDEDGLEVYRTEQNASANLRDLITDAFLRGERAKVMQTDWYNFLSHKRSLSECILAPIEIVCGEPESRTIMQFSSVVGNFEETETGFGVDNGDSDDHGDNEAPFRLHCAYVDFDGKNFGPVGRTFKIPPFDNLKTIKALPVYPLRYAEGTQTRQKLIKRGRMLLEVSNFKAMYYMGATLGKRDEIDSQVVIDFSEALADEKRRKEWEPTIGNIDTTPGNRGSACTAACCNSQTVHDGSSTDIDMTQAFIKRLLPDTSLGQSSLILQPRSLEETLSSASKLSDTELLIMTNRVFGFVLRSRKWAQLDLDLLRYENSNARDLTVDAFERLELPDNHREVLKSLVVQHFRSKQFAFTKNQQTDLIQGKGE